MFYKISFHFAGVAKPIIKVEEVSKPQITEKPKDTNIEEGGEVSFFIKYEGQPDPEVTWDKNGHQMISIRRIKIEHSSGLSKLTIKNARPDDSGTYNVTVQNEHGMDSCSVTLTVGGRI